MEYNDREDSKMSEFELGNADYLLNSQGNYLSEVHYTILDKLNSIRMQNYRIAFSILVLLFIFVNSNFSTIMQNNKTDCIRDKVLNFFEGTHQYFDDHRIIAGLIVTFISLSTDILFFLFLYVWVSNLMTNRFFYSLASFYLASTLLKYSLLVLQPSNFIYSGFAPSLIVKQRQEDSFICVTEIGVLNIIAHEFNQYDSTALKNYTFVVMLVGSFARIVFHGSYLMGVLMSLFLSEVAFQLSDFHVNKDKSYFIKVNRRFSSVN